LSLIKYILLSSCQELFKKKFTPLEGPAAYSGDEDEIAFGANPVRDLSLNGANTGFKALLAPLETFSNGVNEPSQEGQRPPNGVYPLNTIERLGFPECYGGGGWKKRDNFHNTILSIDKN
jgi:hypothetical protein